MTVRGRALAFITVTMLSLASLLPGCSSSPSYQPTQRAAHVGSYRTAAATPGDSLTVVSYNIQYGEDLPGALADLRLPPSLADADILLLQEMDLAGIDSLARTLACDYVYHAAAVHVHHGRLFGNAVLSRWPILHHRLVVLPHGHPVTGQKRIAVVADLDVAGTPVRAVSVHLATVIVSWDEREEQAAAILADLIDFRGPVIIGGDFNTAGNYGLLRAQRLMRKAGLRRALRPTQSTVRKRIWTKPSQKLVLDHLYYRDLELGDGGVRVAATASDHYPIWARFAWPEPTTVHP